MQRPRRRGSSGRRWPCRPAPRIGLRRLDLHLEAQPAGRQAVRLLEPLAQPDHRLDLVDRGDLGQGHDEARRAGRRPRAGRVEERGRGCACPRRAGGGLEALEADAAERRRRAGPRRLGDQRAARRPPSASSSASRPVAVAVLEVDRAGPRSARGPAWPAPGRRRLRRVRVRSPRTAANEAASGGVPSRAASAWAPQERTVSACNGPPGTYTVWTGWRVPRSPG